MSSSDEVFTGVPVRDVPLAWPIIEAKIEEACAYSDGKYDAESIRKALLEQDMQCWAWGGQAVAITQIVVYPRKTVCYVVAAAGSGMKDWLDFEDRISAWARKVGCHALEAVGRNGWARVLGKRGWEQVHVTMRKTL